MLYCLRMRILIFTASAGNGHNSAGNRIAEKFKKEQPDCEVEIVDAYKQYASKLSEWIIEKGYFFACNYLLEIYNHFFKLQEKENVKKGDQSDANRQTYTIMHGMLKKIYEFKPDLIICTYFYTAIAMANLKRVYHIPAKVACMTLDYGVSPFWQCAPKGLDYMFLTDEKMIDPFKRRGYKAEQLFVTGIPISEKFCMPNDKFKCREMLNLDSQMFTLLVMKASFFPISEFHLINQIKKIKTPIQIVIINGKSKESQKKIDRLLKHLKTQHKIINIGFTNQIPEYLFACDIVLGKAGGLTTTETLTIGKPSLIIDKLPQQEIYNRDYLVENGCALTVSKNDMAKNIDMLAQNTSLYNSMLESVEKIKRPNAVEEMYKILKDIPKADYSQINFTDTKYQTIRKVDTQRRIAIKEKRQAIREKKLRIRAKTKQRKILNKTTKN